MMKTASILKRVYGGVIDFLLLAIYMFFSAVFINPSRANITPQTNATTSAVATQTPLSDPSLNLTAFLIVIFGFLLLALCEYYTGRTPGKWAANTRVVTESGGRISMTQALIRNLCRFIDSFGFYLAGLIALVTTNKTQRIGDLCAKTLVIDETGGAI